MDTNDTTQKNLRTRYLEEILPKLKESLRKKNVYQVPRIYKIVVNTGFGKQSPDQKQREQIVSRLAIVTGQKPLLTTAKKAIAGFKTRKGQIIGVKSTLRGPKMYHFFEKLVSIVLPRLRDFRGMSEGSFDGKGNYTIGFREMNVFPEVEYARGEKPLGLEVVICTTAKDDQEARSLLSELGVPFKEKENRKKQVEKVAI
jgi:large subunit ribosomal protein L5